MSSVLKIPHKYDLCITQSERNHGVSGHIYEIIDYYLLLKDHFNVCMLIVGDFPPKKFIDVIKFKYNLTPCELDELMLNVFFKSNIHILISSNVLVVDGYYGKNNFIINADNIFMFACPVAEAYSKCDNHYVLMDYRVYEEGKNTIDYKKKIYFDKIKKPTKTDNSILLYGTKNCRIIDDVDFVDISFNYNRSIVCISDAFYKNTEDITYFYPPIDNLFELFSTYIYTPVSVEFDCSPRFIAECKYFDKDVIYHNIKYEDKGLYWRKYDIENDFSSLRLNQDDEIIEIIGSKIG